MSVPHAVRVIIATSVLLAAPSLTLVAQDVASPRPDPPIRTSVCDLLNQADQFNGTIVTVRGRIMVAFEDFRIDASSCRADKRLENNIWLEYGRGPKKQPTTWCCGDNVPRDSLLVIQNSEFRALDRYLTAETRAQSYEITATITGRFDTKGATCSMLGCYGHFGAFPSRIVIQTVADVSAKRISASEKH